MKQPVIETVLGLCLVGTIAASAEVRYVDVNNTNPAAPYSDWATAATNIQQAVNAAAAGDQVLVTNGVYSSFHVDNKSLVLTSVNGPQLTTILGNSNTRCAYLRNDNVGLSGFTLTNGSPPYYDQQNFGGGVYCWGTNAVVSNCVIVGCSATYGGGIYGERGSRIINCTVINNSAGYGAGAAGTPAFLGPGFEQTPGCILINCTLAYNSAGVYGGAAWGSESDFGSCSLVNCTLTNNSANIRAAAAVGCFLSGCILSRNHANNPGQPSIYLCQLTNCQITATAVSVVEQSQLYNCTLADNSGLVGPCSLRNCILYHSNYAQNSDLNYCCTSILPTTGSGNIAADPQFVQPFGDWRLQSNSPCINAGDNTYASMPSDLDGAPRITGGTVDIGAYEFQSPASVLSYAWAQQNGLATDGSADFADVDFDGMNNWQEWVAGTVPTNAASALRMFAPLESGLDVLLSWQSVSNRRYSLERASTLAVPLAFSILSTNIVGRPVVTSYTHTNASSLGPFFYRVRVQ